MHAQSVRPVVHCLAAAPVTHGEGVVRGTPIIVSLETAHWLMVDYGWQIVGPDPLDLRALAEWEQEDEATRPFNAPRRS